MNNPKIQELMKVVKTQGYYSATNVPIRLSAKETHFISQCLHYIDQLSPKKTPFFVSHYLNDP